MGRYPVSQNSRVTPASCSEGTGFISSPWDRLFCS